MANYIIHQMPEYGMGKSFHEEDKTEIPVCSVCIANYNGSDVICSCIDSILAQDCRFPVEIIIHDDASSDDSVALIKEKYPFIKLLISRDNVGFCVSNNRMASVAVGRYLLLLNNDASLFPDAIGALKEFSNSRDDSVILGLPQYDMENHALIDRGSMLDLFLNPVPNKNAGRRDVGMVIGACLWIPKIFWDKLGGFPDYFHHLAEDTYLCYLARLWGYGITVLPESGFHHWVGKSIGGGKVYQGGLHTTYSRRYYSERNKIFVMMLCYPHMMFYLLLPLHFIFLAAEGLMLCFVKRNALIWRKIYGAVFKSLWREKYRLIRDRGKIQKNRRINLGRFLSSFILYPYKIKMFFQHGLPKIK